jgi:hypothetical protein
MHPKPLFPDTLSYSQRPFVFARPPQNHDVTHGANQS